MITKLTILKIRFWTGSIALSLLCSMFPGIEAFSAEWTHTYDAAGRLARVADSTAGAVDYTYDNLDRLILEVTPQGAVAYAYDAIGRRTSMTVSGLPPVTYTYDAASRLTRVAQGSQVVSLQYDAAGRRTSLVYPNGTVTTYSYDAASHLMGITHSRGGSAIESVSYFYDAVGNRTNVVRSNGTAPALPSPAQAAYDVVNQQIQFNSSASNQTFDANGNLLTKTDASGTTTYTWDARNRLLAISGPGINASFTYDAVGRRTGKTINGVATQYIYDGLDIVAEISGGAISVTYLRGLNLDEPFVRNGATIEFYHTDVLGSVLALTDNSGNVRTAYTYDPFGNTTVTGVPSSNSFQFTGRENDGTGLYYLRARYYSPIAHRFLSEDSALDDGGINLYLYARDNPLSFIDPTGLTTWPGAGPPTSPFGPRNGGFHGGVDIANPLGGAVVASDTGIVRSRGTGTGTGPSGENQVVINHPGNGTTGYSHVTPVVPPGSHVTEGQIIGYTDNSGNARGSGHVHYTYRPCHDCSKVDPLTHLPKQNNYPTSPPSRKK